MDNREHLADAEEALRIAMDGRMAQVWTALPGIVQSADLGTQTLSVQPSIQGAVSDEQGNVQYVNLPLLVDVPIVWPRGGGFACTLPISAGDEVLVVFASRCIDAWWQSGGIGQPAELRMHDLSDGFAIPAPTSQPKRLSSVQGDGIELRNEARTTYIKLTDGKIYIKGDIEHEGNTEQTGDYALTGDQTINGNLTVSGTTTTNALSAGLGGGTSTFSGRINHNGVYNLSGNFLHNGGSMTSLGRKVDGSHTHPHTEGDANTGVPNA